MTQHWFEGTAFDSVNISGYYLIDYYSRTRHIHGGTAILCKNHIKAQPVEEIKSLSLDLHFECAASKFTDLITNIIVIVIYRSSSNGNNNLVFEKFNIMLDILSKKIRKYK